ncbi:MAG: hypothetical protein GY946_04940 [bacterium]|nr:hypothetical protein [bacterium]
MSLSFTDLKSAVQNMLDDAGTTTGNQIEVYLNWALRDVARDHNWPELLARDFVQLTQPYADGTITATNGSTTLTGASTTFTSAMVGRRFALGYHSPWYEIAAFVSTTEVTLADAYAEETVAGQTYTIYEPLVEMPDDCGQILSIKLHGATSKPIILDQSDRGRVGGYGHLPGSAGVPSQYATVDRGTNGVKRIEVGPLAPEDAYRLEVSYKKVVNADQMNLDKEREQLVVFRTLYYAYQRDRHDLVQTYAGLYRSELRQEISRARESVRSADIGEAFAPSFKIDPRLTTYNPDSLGDV